MAHSHPPDRQLFRFGPYTLDVCETELRNDGVPVDLGAQPFDILLMLIERRGQTVRREEILERLWPNQTIADFAIASRHIEAGVRQLRNALLDSAEMPRYIESVAQRGYRFLAEVREIAPGVEAAPLPRAAPATSVTAGPDIDYAAPEADSIPGDALISLPVPGAKFGPYEMVSAIGRGGMGEVWKARDPHLNREVAIKVSALKFTDRFEREARAIAALNHPNICTLFDIGTNYLVMELVEGSNLAQHIGGAPIPLDEALAIAKQVATALEAAHDIGVVHGDLKPANIKIRSDGSVKILDFGLATVAKRDEELTSEATATTTTVPGPIMGAPAYMAPEQARGEKVDKRADIWAFGVLLCEMLTGKPPFTRATASGTLAAVLTAEPDLSGIPIHVSSVLERCLRKEVGRRWRDIGDVRMALEEGTSAALVAVVIEPASPGNRRILLALAAAGIAIAALAAGHFLWR